MTFFFNLGRGRGVDREDTATQLRDFAEQQLVLGPQRMLIFTGALILQAFYLNIVFALVCAILVAVAEMYDRRSFAKARLATASDPARLRGTLRRIHIGALFGSLVVSFFALSVAFGEPGTPPFLPLIFLMAAAVFAAMHNHQIVSVLIIRLGIYGLTFLTIPLFTLLTSRAPLHPETWLNFFTALFVFYFVVDCSIIGLRYYRTTKRQLAQLRVENARANAALAAKTEFLATVSHELRTPLTSIRASLDMSMSGAFGHVPDKSAQVLGIAQRNAARLGKLIDELMDLQKIEIGKMQFDFSDVQLAALISDAVADNTAYAQQFGVTLTMMPLDTDIYVHADPMRLEQVITNLLSNAAKFSPTGSEVRLSVSATPARVRINVCDLGTGIQPEDRARIFEGFNQLDDPDQRKMAGTGLGLNISKRIVEAHAGHIDFEANDGPGTTFFIELARLPTVQTAQPLRAQPTLKAAP